MKDLVTVSLEEFSPLPEGSAQYPVEFIESRGAIKLREDDERITVGLTERADSVTIATIRKFHKQAISFNRINSIELSAYLGKKMGESVLGGAGNEIPTTDDRVLLDKLANDAPIVNLVNSICIEGIRSGASDIHIEAGPLSARVRYRLDGMLRTIRTIESGRFPAVSSRIKIMANLNILERRQPQDGRITVSVGNESVDLRVSIVPVASGESIVLRILGKNAAPLSLEELGFAPDQLLIMRALLRIPHGLLLVTGPTGSGKTTTLNAMIREIVSEDVKIITIEDPVEFLVDGVNQIQINEQIGLGFDVLLRRVLRQDPNVIMIGEIRDGPTAEIAIRAALTGHLVLSTLHTNDSVSVIPRLVNMGVEPYLIASVLRGAVAQRLVRKLCPNCIKTRKTKTREARILASFDLPSKIIHEKIGCDACGNTGYRGRTVLSEIFANDPDLENLILHGEGVAVLSSHLAKQGMKTLAKDGAYKIADGLTTLAEVEREIVFSGYDN